MISWLTKLEAWNYPKASELAPKLEEIGLDPNRYTYPWELGKDLHSLIDQRTKTIYVRGEWRPLAWYDPILDFFKWLWEQIYNLFKPYIIPIVLVAIGGLITYIAHGYYKALGAVPIGVAIYLLLKNFGVI
jgi:hypothetical protein